VSWIPSEAIEGVTKLPFELGVGHYDAPPPDRIDRLADLHAAGMFRFANELRAYIEVEDDRIVAHGQAGSGYINQTFMRVGPLRLSFQPTAFPELRPEPQVSDDHVTFRQTTGGRAGVPAPRRVRGRPFLQLTGPIVWTTLELTLRADGTTEGQLVGASRFPRHWLYDGSGRLVAKSGVTDFREWYAGAFGQHSPWGDEDSAVLMATASTALEQVLSNRLMRGAKPKVRRLEAGELLTEQGQPGDELYLLLDGIMAVEVDGDTLAEVGPGAVVGERAILEGGRRTATLRAITACRVAVAGKDAIDTGALAALATGHRREEG
jgi:hypothetical protein